MLLKTMQNCVSSMHVKTKAEGSWPLQLICFDQRWSTADTDVGLEANVCVSSGLQIEKK